MSVPRKDIKFNLDTIPETVAAGIAAAVLDGVQDFLRQPGGKEYLDKKIDARKST